MLKSNYKGDDMTTGLWVGILFAIIAFFTGHFMWKNWKRSSAYEHAIRAHLGGDSEWVFDQTIMWDYYDASMSASDCAREMLATCYED